MTDFSICDPHCKINPGFEWPKGEGKYARFQSGLWIGAQIGRILLYLQL